MSDPDQDILDAIEQGSFNYAQSLLSIRLKKYPNNTYYGALNCYLLLSSGKINESIDQSLKLMAKVPNDPKTLGLLYTIFNKAGRSKEASVVYENTVKKYPTNSIILSWFETSLKNFDLKALQKSTMNLQEVNKSNRSYSMWSSLSCLILSNNSKDPKESLLFNKLGLKLLENLQPLLTTQEVFVYVKLLYNLEEFSQIESYLHQYKSANVLDLELKLIYLDILNILEKWDSLYSYANQLIFKEKFNDFDTWKYLISSSFQRNSPVSDLKNIIISHPKSRNSKLALVEMAKVYNVPMDEFVFEYYNEFNHKSCCFNDLKYYCKSFDTENFKALINDSITKLKSSSQGDINILIGLVNNQKFKLLFNDTDSGFCAQNWEIYGQFKHLLKVKELTDFYPAHELILINIILELKKSKKIETILKNVCIIERLLIDDKSNFNLKLWQIKLYSYLNCQSLVFLHYQKLNIKMIQHNTLSHYLIERNCFPCKNNLSYLINIYRFYLTAEYEINDNIMLGFKKEIFNKLENFLKFGDNLNKSISKYNLLLEILKISRVTNDSNYYNYFSNNIKSFEISLLNESFSVSDNRDNKIHWKFGINEPLEEGLLDLGPQYGEEYIKLNYIKELIILNINNSNSLKLFKLFNKYLNNNLYLNQLTVFEKWLFKVYLSVFKYIKFDNPKENESIEKFLVKNLKLDKINSLINSTESILSWEVNYILVNLVDLSKVLTQLSRFESSKKICSINKTLISDLKSLNCKKLQVNKLNELKAGNFDFDKNLNLDANFVSETFQIIENSIYEASIFNLRF